MYQRFALLLFFMILSGAVFSQTAVVKGRLSDEDGNSLGYATVSLAGTNIGISANENGEFYLKVPSGKDIILLLSFTGKKTKIFSLNLLENQEYLLNEKLETEDVLIDSVIVKDSKDQNIEERRQVSTTRLDPKLPKFLPSPFGDFNKILATLPGVQSNSELSSQYTVRGGNFDENLVYVNDIEIYKPFLVRAGQQEGLSFVNPDMVSQVDFSAGGWQSRYGDKLSSVLAVKYKEPKKFKGSATLSLLTASLHLENATKNRRVSYIVGARQKSAQYLLNTLPVKGQYKPKFYDIQSYISFDLTHRRDSNDLERRTTLGILSSYSRNRYFVQPSSQETTFGTLDQLMKLSVQYQGQEVLEYTTYQSGIKLSHIFSEKVKTDFILSGVNTTERENSDVFGTYQLSEISADPNSSNFNTSAVVIGSGGLYDHARNKLQATIFNFLHRGYYNYNSKNKFEWGFGESHESIQDKLKEYSFLDSADYINITKYLSSSANLSSYRTQAYLQHSVELDSSNSLTYGVRLNYWTLNKQLLVSPRLQYAFQPKWRRDFLFKLGTGLYQQPGFYRELRDRQGVVHPNLKAQSSFHFILGSDYNFKGWGNRPFKFISEAYYKYLWNVIPYDVDNVRLRYFGANCAKAYAVGADFRVSGEFIKGVESWFNLGILSTKENIDGDNRGYIRRPTDQRVTASIFFQDHLPRIPSVKVYLNLVYGTGLPFGPPNSAQYRSALSGPQYKRVDIGFSKLLTFVNKDISKGKTFESIWISLEVLNLLGAKNTISYMWITDVNSHQYAIPNTLSQRYLNLRMIAKF
jgi:hypothetical protein